MRVLLDNCIDRNFAALITGHDLSHASTHGWGGLENGKLLSAAHAAGFAAMITVDKNIRYQQNLARLPLTIIELDARRSHVDELARFAPHIPAALAESARFAFLSIGSDGAIERLGPRPHGS